jgi:hypothetical protein
MLFICSQQTERYAYMGFAIGKHLVYQNLLALSVEEENWFQIQLSAKTLVFFSNTQESYVSLY